MPCSEKTEQEKQLLLKLWTIIRILFAGSSLAAVVTGIAYLPVTPAPSSLPTGLEIITSVVPVWAWGALWVIAGLAGLIASAVDLRRPWLAIGTALQVGMCFVWAASYSVAWFTEFDRAYVNAASYWRQCLPILAVAIAVRILRSLIQAARFAR